VTADAASNREQTAEVGMIMNTGWFAKFFVVGLTATALTGCGDVVVKVQKKSKSAEIKSVENQNSVSGDLALTSAEDFLKHLDNLKGAAADIIIKQLASRDYAGEFRTAVRKYRSFLIERARMPVKIDDSFYAQSSEQCRKTGISLNMDQSNEFLGLILKTALLAKMGEVSAGNLNPGLSKEIAAISKLIMSELGLKIEGDASVDKSGDASTKRGKFSISLMDIEGETINGELVDAQTKARDAAEVLTIEFERSLGADLVGTFTANISISALVGEGETETLAAMMKVEREKLDGRFVHGLAFETGVAGLAPNYKRAMTFEQTGEGNKQIKLTDILSPGMKGETTFVTVLDIEKGTQCKFVADDTNKAVDPSVTDPGKKTDDTTDDLKKDSTTPDVVDDGKKGEETPVVVPSKPTVIDPSVSTQPGQGPGQHNTPGQHVN